MKIFVCVKQVPDTSGHVAVHEDGTMNRAAMAAVTNPDDLCAVEAALSIKDTTPDCRVIVLSMGPPSAAGMLKELLAMGADEAALISSREFGGSDTFATSQVLAGAITHLGFGEGDLILCGRQAIDGDTAQVGPQIAEKLGIPQVTYVTEIRVEGHTLAVRRALEDGYMVIRAELPCLLTCMRELNKPRYMTVRGIYEAGNKPLRTLDYEALKDEPLLEADTIGLQGSPTNVFKSFSPPLRGRCVMLSGAPNEAVGALFDILRENHVVPEGAAHD